VNRIQHLIIIVSNKHNTEGVEHIIVETLVWKILVISW